jgi:hypothetical protein
MGGRPLCFWLSSDPSRAATGNMFSREPCNRDNDLWAGGRRGCEVSGGCAAETCGLCVEGLPSGSMISNLGGAVGIDYYNVAGGSSIAGQMCWVSNSCKTRRDHFSSPGSYSMLRSRAYESSRMTSIEKPTCYPWFRWMR